MPKEDKLEGWSKVINEMHEQGRKRRAEDEKEKAAQMRIHFVRRIINGIRQGHIIDWDSYDEPNLWRGAPPIVLKSDKLLAFIWDEMHRRKMWHDYLNELIEWQETKNDRDAANKSE